MTDSADEMSLDTFLAGLPDGLASYPECQTKGSLIRSTLRGHDPRRLAAGLPDPLRALVEEPPPEALWVPAVHGIALVHAVCDRYYPSEEKVLDWGRRRAESLAASRLYRALVRVSGPRVVFSMTARLNGLFQRGTSFAVETLESNRAVARLSYPPRLHTRRSLLGTVSVCRVLIQHTGGRVTSAEMTECGETAATFEATWSARSSQLPPSPDASS